MSILAGERRPPRARRRPVLTGVPSSRRPRRDERCSTTRRGRSSASALRSSWSGGTGASTAMLRIRPAIDTSCISRCYSLLRARSPEDAVEAFLDPLHQAALCVSQRPLVASGFRPSRQFHVVSFVPRGESAPVRLHAGPVALALRVALRFEVVGEVSLGERLPAIAVGSAHFPTGFVGLAQVVSLLIAEFGARPLRPDWQQAQETVLRGSVDVVLDDHRSSREAGFARKHPATWSSTRPALCMKA